MSKPSPLSIGLTKEHCSTVMFDPRAVSSVESVDHHAPLCRFEASMTDCTVQPLQSLDQFYKTGNTHSLGLRQTVPTPVCLWLLDLYERRLILQDDHQLPDKYPWPLGTPAFQHRSIRQLARSPRSENATSTQDIQVIGRCLSIKSLPKQFLKIQLHISSALKC